MLSTKIRPAVIALVTTASLAFTLAAPAASQAQWHTIVVGGHVFTHGNFTEGGVSPCDRINEQLGKWQGAVGDDNDWLNRKGIGPPAKPMRKRNWRMPKAKSTAPAAKPSNTAATPWPQQSRRTAALVPSA
jgi:hypothetical protein